MRTLLPASGALLVAFLAALQVTAEDTAPQGTIPPPPAPPGFTAIPAGVLHPGCTPGDYKARAGTSEQLKLALIYDQWGAVPEVKLGDYFLGRFGVTNAQWKSYLDDSYRTEVETTGSESLVELAIRNVVLGDQGQDEEWRAIYCLNKDAIDKALVAAQKWDKTFEEDPQSLREVVLPKGVKLVFYRHRTPRHWFGWHPLSGLRSEQEYCDIRKPAAEAFRVPEGETFAKLRARDFAAHPIRDISIAEALRFAETYGAHLMSEYEYERAGRGDRPNTDQHTFPGKWDRAKQAKYFVWADNRDAAPLPVDDESVQQGDGPFGNRHLLGNLWEMTRTMWDKHPNVTPKLPNEPHGLFNYAMVAKGGSWGDPWYFIQLSTRTGVVGENCELSLQYHNRADSLGFRLARHPKPCLDLLLHSMLRLVYNPGQGRWSEPWVPPTFSQPRAAGVDTARFEESASPYIHARQKARGIGILPLWVTDLDEPAKRKTDNPGADLERATDFRLLGVFRCDTPIYAGVRLSKQDAEELDKIRKAYEEWRRNPPKAEKGKKPPPPPPEPPPEDAYERAAKGKMGGIWREKLLPGGEWLIGYWRGHIALANKAFVPEAFLPMGARTLERIRTAEPAKVTLEPAKDLITLTFSVEEGKEGKIGAPEVADSELWALCETLENGWPGRKAASDSWRATIDIRTGKDALKNFNGNR